MKKIIFAAIISIIIICIIIFSIYYSTLIDADNPEKLQSVLIKTISQQYKGSKSVDASALSIKAVEQYGELRCIYFQYQNSNYVTILKRDYLFNKKYKHFGQGTSSSDFDTYNFWDGRTKQGIIIVYGNNTILHATKYKFTNSNNTYQKIIDQEYVLDIYILDNSDNASSNGYIYDNNDDVICLL